MDDDDYETIMNKRVPARLCNSSRIIWKLVFPLLTLVASTGLVFGNGALFAVVVESVAVESTPTPPSKSHHSHSSAPKKKTTQPSPPPPLKASSPPAASKASPTQKADDVLQKAEAAVLKDQRSLANREAAQAATESSAPPTNPLSDYLTTILRTQAVMAAVPLRGGPNGGRALLGSRVHAGIEAAVFGDDSTFNDLADSGKHVIQSFSLVEVSKELWEEKEYALALSMIVFSGVWPAVLIILMLALWWVKISPDLRQGMSLMLKVLAKWSLLHTIFLSLWISIFRADVPLGQVRIQADWGCTCYAGSLCFAYFVLVLSGSFEKGTHQRRKAKVDSRQSVHFHAFFFMLAALTTVLLVASLTLPAYSSSLILSHQNTDGDTVSTRTGEQFTLLTAGHTMWRDGGWSSMLAVLYIILVTTMPGMFLVLAVVAWVTSPLEREGDEDTTVAMGLCNMCGRLTSMDVWLYAFGMTYLKLQNVANILTRKSSYSIELSLEVHMAVYCTAGCLLCLWMMHTLAEYAHSPEGMEAGGTEKEELIEPVFAPPPPIVEN